MKWHLCLLFLFLLILNENSTSGFKAAVFEHAQQSYASSGVPKDIIRSNLDYYKTAANLARSKDVDIIVFSEYGIIPDISNRKKLREYLEYIPDPKKTTSNPCKEYAQFSDRPILYTLSCLARENNMIIVANMGDIQPCKGEKNCPKDGAFHFNTNVAFGRDGAILAKYHKEHLFMESAMDLPPFQQDPTFKTDIGNFAIMKFQTVLSPKLTLLWMTMMVGHALAMSKGYYTAAVFEHTRVGDEIKDNATVVIKANLENYDRATIAAAKQGADVIVFPEYGIFPPVNRSLIRKFLELIPDPKVVTVTPCDEAELFADRPITYTLSCMAKYNDIVIVANMGGIERCETESDCPDDGLVHLNANVVFDQNGTLIARYYKERLFYEEGMDLPLTEQDPVFQTTFGKFATFICFDIIFEKMTKTAQRTDIDAIMFSWMSLNMSPFYVSIQTLESWAIGNNATVIAANVQMPGYLATGSGIFMGRKGSVGHTLNPDGVSKLVVAKIVKNNRSSLPDFNITAIFKNGTQNWDDDRKNIPDVCSYSILGSAENVNKDYRCADENLSNYTLKKLLKSKDHIQVCNNKMCCELEYAANHMNESYYIGVYNGTISPFTRYFWWEENCFLGRCDDVNGTACSIFPMTTKTMFQKIYMKANFTSKSVFPSLVADKLKLAPVEDWSFDAYPGEASILFESTSGIPLLSATLKGRLYEKDPPRVR